VAVRPGQHQAVAPDARDELPGTVVEDQRAVRGETAGRDRAVRQVLQRPSPLLGEEARQPLGLGLNALRAEPLRDRQQQLHRRRVVDPREHLKQGFALAHPRAVLLAHVAGDEGDGTAVGARGGDREQAAVGDGRRAGQVRVDPLLQHEEAERTAV
jgi:hypothetical protein